MTSAEERRARQREATRRYRAAHPERVKEYAQKYKAENRERVLASYRNTRLRRTLRIYGITQEELNQKKADQGGLCAICRVGPATEMDHDHTNGRLRGILCMNCNLGLGSLKDSPSVLRSALEYLTQYGKT